MQLLFSFNGRINRGRFWLGALFQILLACACFGLLYVLKLLMPGTATEGGFNASGVEAIPYLVLMFGWFIAAVWSGLCLGVKRYHDRDKSGAWVLIQFVPVIGPLWYLVEAGCLAGTPGPNRFGGNPLTGTEISNVFA